MQTIQKETSSKRLIQAREIGKNKEDSLVSSQAQVTDWNGWFFLMERGKKQEGVGG